MQCSALGGLLASAPGRPRAPSVWVKLVEPLLCGPEGGRHICESASSEE